MVDQLQEDKKRIIKNYKTKRDATYTSLFLDYKNLHII